MKFGFRRNKQERVPDGRVAKSEFVDADPNAEAVREAIRSSSISEEIKPVISASNIQENTKHLGILILPESENALEFWTLYRKIEQSGLQNHVGIFKKTGEIWTEEKLEE